MIQSMHIGKFSKLQGQEAWDALQELSVNSQQWNYYDPRSRSNSSPKRGGKYVVKNDFDIRTSIEKLERKVKALVISQTMNYHVQSKKDVCSLCRCHNSQSCPSFHETFSKEANALHSYGKTSESPFSSTHNPNWRNHPNFSWRQNQPQINQGQQFNMPNQSHAQQNQSYSQQRKPSLEDTLQQFMQSTHQILQNQSQSIAKLETQMGQIATTVTERERGKLPSQPIPNMKGQYEIGMPSHNEEAKSILTLRSGKNIVKPDYTPQVEKDKEKKRVNLKIPAYSKFLKDLYTIKRNTNVPKKAFLTEQVSSIIQYKTHVKYKDPGCPTISCIIGDHIINKALLDLGASVNLLPYSVYKQLGLGELKPTSITLQLVDRSVKIPRGRPFLATSNAIINCRNAVLKVSFGNMTIELNVFNIAKSVECEEIHEMNMIENVFDIEGNESFEKCAKYFESAPLMNIEHWKTKIEPFSPLERVQSISKPPKLDLKPLPKSLKYAFLGESNTYPVIIPFDLDKEQ
ncbi:uncharacterized protein LOC115713165 [Cannabis sativa]|uniref:uncharacterized protein LOC115713165 n=1 Tax=Cannabis sativa TaxID=3483 RepID=UPI0029C9FD38|nr:uncharacterized protein LOC115713165 [Cannabis sativa]